MQAVSISNVSPTAAPVPAAVLPANVATTASPTAQQSSPFTALFQTALKGPGDGKLPFAGKPKDSARGQDAFKTIPSYIPQLAVALPGPVFSPVLPTAQTPDVGKGIANPEVGAFPELNAESEAAQTALSAIAQAPVASKNVPRPKESVFPGVNFGGEPVQPSLSGLLQTPVSWKNIAGPEGSASSDPTVESGSAKPSLSATSQSAPSFGPAPIPTISGTLSGAIDALENANPTASDSLPSNPVAAQASSGTDSNNAVPDSQSIPVDPSAQTNVPAIAITPQALANPAVTIFVAGDLNLAAVPNASPEIDVSSTGPQQAKNSAAATVPQGSSAATTLSAKIRDLQAAHTAVDLPSIQISKPQLPQAVSPSQTPPPSISGALPQFDSRLQAAGKNLASVTSATSSRETAQSPSQNNTQPAPVGVAPITAQSKDTSSGSQGNDTNGKSDHSPRTPGDSADAKGFVQSLEIAGSGPGSAPPATTNSPVAVALPQAPVVTSAASSDGKPGAGSGAALLQGASMPAAAGESQPTVSAAHLTDHAGQTEIRIEMQADSLGGVELRAHITGDQIGASISAEHHETQMLLVNELPSLRSALAEKNLRVDSLTVSQGMPSSMGGGLGSGAEHRWFSQSNPKPAYSIQDEVSLPAEGIPVESMNPGNLGGRLSVLA